MTAHAALTAFIRCAAILYSALLAGGIAAAGMWRSAAWEMRMIRLYRRMERR